MKWFTVAKEGQTADGRTILRAWLEQIAETYNTKTYGARIWLEHYRGILPDGPFRAYGDVSAVRTIEEDGALLLQAQIDPTSDLIAMNKARQKLYTSIEIDPDFAGTGKCYLTGLAVTDKPASLGTEMLKFCAQVQDPAANPLAARKQRPENMFSAALLADFDFSEDKPTEPAADERESRLLGRLTEIFRSLTNRPAAGQSQQFKDLAEAFEAFATGYGQAQQTTGSDLASIKKTIEGLAASYVSVADFNALKEKLEFTDRNPQTRPRSTGARGDVELTDC